MASGSTVRDAIGVAGTRPHWPALDGVRGIAVVMVVLYHFVTPRWFPFDVGGYLGVELFFVLSGFLITALLVGEFRATGSLSLRRFYARRVLRLQPAQLALAAFVVLVAVTFAPDDTRRALLAGVGSSLLYFANWVKAYGWWNQGAMTHTWSLAIEEQYYLLWAPVVFLVARRFGAGAVVRVAIAATVAGFAWRVAMYSMGATFDRMYNGTDTRVAAIMVGSAIGAACATGALPTPGRPDVLAGAGLIAVVGLGLFLPDSRELQGFGLTAVDLLIGLTILGCVSLPAEGRVTRWLSARPLVVVGRVSFGLYLWHKAIIVLVNGRRFGLNWWTEAVVETAIFVPATYLSWRWIERPAGRHRQRFEVRLSPTGPTGPPPAP